VFEELVSSGDGKFLTYSIPGHCIALAFGGACPLYTLRRRA
jgi:hypothetical protein